MPYFPCHYLYISFIYCTYWVPTISVLNLAIFPCYSILLLRRRRWTGILWRWVLGYVLPRLSFLWCYGVFHCSFSLRAILVFKDIIYVIIILYIRDVWLSVTTFGRMCGTIDPGSFIRWVLSFGMKTRYDSSGPNHCPAHQRQAPVGHLRTDSLLRSSSGLTSTVSSTVWMQDSLLTPSPELATYSPVPHQWAVPVDTRRCGATTSVSSSPSHRPYQVPDLPVPPPGTMGPFFPAPGHGLKGQVGRETLAGRAWEPQRAEPNATVFFSISIRINSFQIQIKFKLLKFIGIWLYLNKL
jgi:hypothetical protein